MHGALHPQRPLRAAGHEARPAVLALHGAGRVRGRRAAGAPGALLPARGARAPALLRSLGIAGALAYTGSIGNALLLSSGYALPFGMYLVLAALLVLVHVINAHQPPADRRLLERSLVYSAMAAVLSAGFLFGVLTLLAGSGQPFLAEYRVGAFFLLALAALAFEPVRQGTPGVAGAAAC
ncbi:hypothetical protein ACLESO_14970 [Pyxidicoccus sp. 3LG]